MYQLLRYTFWKRKEGSYKYMWLACHIPVSSSHCNNSEVLLIEDTTRRPTPVHLAMSLKTFRIVWITQGLGCIGYAHIPWKQPKRHFLVILLVATHCLSPYVPVNNKTTHLYQVFFQLSHQDGLKRWNVQGWKSARKHWVYLVSNVWWAEICQQVIRKQEEYCSSCSHRSNCPFWQANTCQLMTVHGN